MTRRQNLTIGLGLLGLCLTGFWWLLLEGSPPATAPDYFKISQYRELVKAESGERPRELRIEIVGTDIAPGIAAETGSFSSDYHLAFTSLQLVWPDKTYVIGGAVDAVEARNIQQSKTDAFFYEENYKRLTDAMLDADRVMITHEHIDHIMAAVKHPNPDALAPKLLLNPDQLSGISALFGPEKSTLDLQKITTDTFSKPTLIAPGVVVDRHPGHTEGNQTFFISLESGQEYLLIGDIVWKMSNISNLKTRPRLLQHLLFEPNEDRKIVLSQVRALHDLQKRDPQLVIVPSHDFLYLKTLIENGSLQEGFREGPLNPAPAR